MKQFLLILLLLPLLLCACGGTRSAEVDAAVGIDYCAVQAERTLRELPPRKIPGTIDHDSLHWRYTGIGSWTCGFWSGILWYLYEDTGDARWLSAAQESTALLMPLTRRRASSHDSGFIAYCSLGNAYRLTGDDAYRQGLLRMADSLAVLYNPVVGSLLSWPRMVRRMNWPHNTIIDNMMNLELLFWAARNGGDQRLYDIAARHAETTMKHHFRPDGSAYHVAVYDTLDGHFIRGVTHQGCADTSMWARGQAWAIYGFTMTYRYTRDPRFLETARRAADIYLRRLPADHIPYWDFDAPHIPDAPRDASAAAITASALLELSTLVTDKTQADTYRSRAVAMLHALSTHYRAGSANPAFLLHSVGHHPNGTEIDASIIYADYYYLEALTRLQRMERGEPVERVATAPVHLVNPFVDSHRSRWFFFASACRPFGMVSLSPDTDTEHSWGSGYLYDSQYIRCFSHIHNWQMSGVAVMPTVGEFKGHLGMDAYRSAFSHEGESARPGYHRVKLSDYDVTAELTSTCRVGFHRYTFPASDESYVLFDTGAFLAHGPTDYSEVWQVSPTDIGGMQIQAATGRRPKDTPVYFYARFDRPCREVVAWSEGRIRRTFPQPARASGKDAGMAARFHTGEGDTLLLKVAISYVSVEQAKRNLDAELTDWDFDRVRRESAREWNDQLGRIEVEGGSYAQRVKFYTDLWHALLGRHIVSDVDGTYMNLAGSYPRIGQIPLDDHGQPRYNHHNFDAWWGSHWSLNILWSMAYPRVMDDFCNTMLDYYRTGGLIPRGPSGGNYTYVMIGDPAVSFFATAYNKGIRGYDAGLAYEGLYKNAFVGGIRDHAGYEHSPAAHSGGMRWYESVGYVPDRRTGVYGMHTTGASMTLEYAYQDWCLAQLAQALGKTDDATFFMKRSQNYRTLWNADSGYMQPRDTAGNWLPDFDPLELSERGGFCESNAAIYSHYVPHDMPGLIMLNGGAERYVQRLNTQFERSEPYGFFRSNAHKEGNWTDYGNQPGTGMAHLFSHAGAPWLTQKWVRRVKAAYADITPYGGYRDDEDQGQMGALGVLMALGLFEVDGGCALEPHYEITSPLFDRVVVHLDPCYYPGKQFEIITTDNADDHPYIRQATLDGKPWNSYRLPHSRFVGGGKLELQMSGEPNKEWGVKE
jgi:predicted alpha-1,2-mannosidase